MASGTLPNAGQSGFPPGIQAALEQAASEVPRDPSSNRRGRFTSWRGQSGARHNGRGGQRGGHRGGQNGGERGGTFQQAQGPRGTSQHPAQLYSHAQSFAPREGDFPPLSRNTNPPRTNRQHGNQPPQAQTNPQVSQQTQFDGQANKASSHPPSHTRQYQPMEIQNTAIIPADAFFQNAVRGAYRGSFGGRGHHPHPTPPLPMSPTNFQPPRGTNRGPGYQQPRLFNPHSPAHMTFGVRPVYPPPNHTIQVSYLDDIGNRELQKSITTQELMEYEDLRKKLERILQAIVAEWAKDNVTVDPTNVKLICYGSMRSGFAVPGSDMDLLLTFPKDEGRIGAIETECRRMFEKKLLDNGYGARLLTKTRVPILRVCQSPGEELLDGLRAQRLKSLEQDREEDIERRMKALGLKANRLPEAPITTATLEVELEHQPASIPLPPSPTQEHATIEFDKSVGIQCDINFSNYVAIHNTALLRCYCLCDDRVRQLGLIVKGWAKTRKINTPYHGSLSSYGYIMMVLHFLMNIADPPVIPNLQAWARADDSWKENAKDIPLFEGFDIRFMGDEKALKKMAEAKELTQNTESLGSLTRGFFQYYADPRGFHFGQEIISIRTRGGVLRKASKGWTEAKRAGDDNSIRLRYLLCIEDPFEIEHNIARTVGHSGIVAIRDEFRRAWDIVNKVAYDPDRGWQWLKNDGTVGEDLFAAAEDRGDLLKKDADFHKERMRLAAQFQKEKAEKLKEAALNQSSDSKSTNGTIGMNGANGNVKSPADYPTQDNPAGKIEQRGESPATDTGAQNAKREGGRGKKSPKSKKSRNGKGKKVGLTATFKDESSGMDEISPATASTEPSPPTPPRMPTPPLSSLSFPFDPNQLRDLQVNKTGGNGCVRGFKGWDIDGSLGGGAPVYPIDEHDVILPDLTNMEEDERKTGKDRKKERKASMAHM